MARLRVSNSVRNCKREERSDCEENWEEERNATVRSEVRESDLWRIRFMEK